jgi:superfamily II DNA or RNA helicase
VARLEELTKGALVRGLLGSRLLKVVAVDWHGSSALTLTYTDEASGRLDQELLDRSDEPRLSIEQASRSWPMDGDPRLFRLASEAKRISLAYLFDPFLAVQTSNLDPLPHQVDAVYNRMLPLQPLRFLLADDPGAGKTIMAGLLVKELIIRGDVERCLVIAPGSLVEQWQDELWQKFALDFKILTRDMIEGSGTGNPFEEQPMLIARLDHLARNEGLQARLGVTDWDLVIVDEAHKMSAHYSGSEVRETKRYRLGQLAGSRARHLVLMTATPHSGYDENFRLFLRLLDADRFEGHDRGGPRSDPSDIMRRLVKEKLLTFDGRPLFPERRAYTVAYPLSEAEARLYARVTDYVRDEMSRADQLRNEGEGSRGAIVGFALTILQRRVASSPEAIYHSLRRRRERLERRAGEARIARRAAVPAGPTRLPDEFDEDDLPEGEREELETSLVDEASAARTVAELEREIAILADLEKLAADLRSSGEDRKWEELSSLLRDTPEMFGPDGSRRKLIIFSEHRDTLTYLAGKLRTLLGNPRTVETIHGGMQRDDRRKAQEAFTQDPETLVLVATDAAGEGINLQRAHLMVNYDLPWNPNRIEQRFGRIHRIGQTEVCHLWNLVAEDTREGDVFQRLFAKLDEQRSALGGQVFDVLGQAFADTPLRGLLIEAVRYGELPDVKDRLNQVVDETVGATLRRVVHDRALVSDLLTEQEVERIRADMQRAQARRLQPHFVQPFFVEAFSYLGGEIREREPGRFEITRVPAEFRQRDRLISSGTTLLRRYERITFAKELITVAGRPRAQFVAPGHPLLDVTVDLVVERFDTLLRQGAVLVDERDPGTEPRTLIYLQHAVTDGRTTPAGDRRTVSRRYEFVEVDSEGQGRFAGWAPYLDLRPATPAEQLAAAAAVDHDRAGGSLEEAAVGQGIPLARAHLDEVRRRTFDRVDRVAAEVRARLEPEIRHWDHRAAELRQRELAGRLPASGMNSGNARQRAEELAARLKYRMSELAAERQLAAGPPLVAGGALVLPAGLLSRLTGGGAGMPGLSAAVSQDAAVAAVLAAERRLGRFPERAQAGAQGYDIESRTAAGSSLFVLVRSRAPGADVLTVKRSELGVAHNSVGHHLLALVDGDQLRYVPDGLGEVANPPFDTALVALPWSAFFSRGRAPW